MVALLSAKPGNYPRIFANNHEWTMGDTNLTGLQTCEVSTNKYDILQKPVLAYSVVFYGAAVGAMVGIAVGAGAAPVST